jgi:hypothetical protein
MFLDLVYTHHMRKNKSLLFLLMIFPLSLMSAERKELQQEASLNFMTFKSHSEDFRSRELDMWVMGLHQKRTFIHKDKKETSISYSGRMTLRLSLLNQDISRIKIYPHHDHVRYWVDTRTFDAYIEVDNIQGQYSVEINGDPQNKLHLNLMPLLVTRAFAN